MTPESPDNSAGHGAASSSWLQPILLDYAARDGSTLLMRLLASSPQIAVEPAYPYEYKYFNYLWRWSRLLDSIDVRTDIWDFDRLGSITQEAEDPLIGPIPWWPREMIDQTRDEQPISRVMFDSVWREFSRRASRFKAAATQGDARTVHYYAEKHLLTWRLDLTELPPTKTIAIVRDPRDIWISIEAVNRQREVTGEPSIGRPKEMSAAEWLPAFITQQRERLRWLIQVDQRSTPVVRYESLVRDLDGEADRLARWLGVTFQVDEVLSDRKLQERHGTSPSAEESIGRWRKEPPGNELSTISAALAPELRALDYDGA